MFDFEDFDKAENDINNRGQKAPSYIIEDTEYTNQLMTITRIIENTNFNDTNSRAAFIMHVINAVNVENDIDNALNTIIAMCSHIIILMKMINGMKDEYIAEFKRTMIDPIIDNDHMLEVWGDE
jgi:hypothetical protein